MEFLKDLFRFLKERKSITITRNHLSFK